jgi:hypothetical protein
LQTRQTVVNGNRAPCRIQPVRHHLTVHHRSGRRYAAEVQSLRIPAPVHYAVVIGLIAGIAWPLQGQAIGVPLTELTSQYTDGFAVGRQRFLKVEDVSSGLGPSYN